jgi:hypothetical protein
MRRPFENKGLLEDAHIICGSGCATPIFSGQHL